MLNQTYPYVLPPLPYAYDALEPYIEAETMHYHHDKHFQAYITNLNNALEPYPTLQKLTLKQLLSQPKLLPTDIYQTVMNQGGGVYNHDLFFKKLASAKDRVHEPKGRLLAQINQTYGSFDSFKNIFIKQALQVFGSGWICLSYNQKGELVIVNLKNQEVALNGQGPIILVDVWEHAYYLKYKNARDEYLQNIWNVIRFPDN